MTNIGKLGIVVTSENLVKEEEVMTDEEILSAAQEHPVAEAENEIMRRAITKALGIGVLLLTAMIVAEIFIVKSIDFGKPALILLIAAVSDILEGKNIGKKKKLVNGILESVCALFFLILYIGGMFI